MSSDSKPTIQRELVDDFCAEGDEHLRAIREALASLEHSTGQFDPAVIDDLFRNFHSFKGISAIVGLRAAEELAHAAEEFFLGFKRGDSTINNRVLDVLMDSAQKLEEMVLAVRNEAPIPNIDFLLASLREMAAHSASATLPVWKFAFRPKRELDDRGVNINTVRARIAAIGDIVEAAPKVTGGGELSFEFVVHARHPIGDVAAWEADGIAAQEMGRSSSAPAAPAAVEKEEPAPAGKSAAATPFLSPSHVMRVDLNRLDELMRINGELVICRSRFEEKLNQAKRTGGSIDVGILQEFNQSLGQSLRELRESIMRVRMVPVSEIFARMPFVVRDLARESNKKARLVLEGQNTEMDKYVLERLKDPLLHLVRNAFSHGVETPEERTAAGKSPEATITLRASSSGDSALIEVFDDGRGVDAEAVVNRARSQGLQVPQAIDSTALLNILCMQGFSTRDDADRAAGRGVGMGVVAETLRDLGGRFSLESELGKGTRFILRLPLTLAIAEALIVSAASQTCAIPQSFVSEVMHVQPEDIRMINRVEMIPYRNSALPVTRLSSMFRLPPSTLPRLCLLVLRSDRGRNGLIVDKIHGQKEVVVRAIRDPLGQAPGIIGATELGDGKPVLILDGEHLTRGAVRPQIADAETDAESGANLVE